MAIRQGITVEQIRDHIDNDIMPKAVAQWEELKEKDPDSEILHWVDGRVDAVLQVLGPIDDEAFDKWVDIRNRQKAKYAR